MRKSTGKYPKDWPKIAEACKERAGWKCERCGRFHEKSRGRGLNVHHLDWNRSNCAWWNLACLCAKCHLFVQKETERQKTWMLSDAPWLQKHIDGYIQSIIDKLNPK